VQPAPFVTRLGPGPRFRLRSMQGRVLHAGKRPKALVIVAAQALVVVCGRSSSRVDPQAKATPGTCGSNSRSPSKISIWPQNRPNCLPLLAPVAFNPLNP